MSTSARIVLAALVCVAAVPLAKADECHLERVASLDMTMWRGGLIVPTTINGAAKTMLIDTGAPLSTLDPQTVQDLQLATHTIRRYAMFDSDGREFRAEAIIPTLQIGAMQATDVPVLVQPSALSEDNAVAGLLGADFLRHYEIELDFAAHKLNLLSQNHCPGQVIYWKADAVAVVPIRMAESAHIIVPVRLDGHDLDAILDTGAFGTILSAEAASGVFGLHRGSPELPEAEKTDDPSAPFYKHTFKTLELEGITIRNPTVFIREDLAKKAIVNVPETGTRLGEAEETGGNTQLILGMNELKHLHILISYKEQKLYITAGTPPSTGAPPAPVPAVASPAPGVARATK